MGDRRARGWAIGVIVAVLLGVTAWWLWRAVEANDGGTPDESGAGIDGSGGSGGTSSGAASDDSRPEDESAMPARGIAPLRLGTARVERDEAAVYGAISGVVLSRSTEQPVAAATITFTHAGRTLDVTSNENGRFELRPRAAGRYELSFVSADEYLPYAPEWGHSPIAFELRPGARIDGVRVHLVPALAYTGRVVDTEGNPIAGAEVRLLGASTGEQRLAPLADRFTTDADGEITFHAPDDAVLEAHHPEHGTGRGVVGFETQVSKLLVITLDPDVTERAGATIAGRVVDADGEPFADAIVRAVYEVDNRAAHGTRLHPTAETATEPDGRFVLERLDRGEYTLVASARGHANARETGVASGARDVVLELGREARIEGVVVDEAGAPVPAFTVVAQVRIGALERRNVAVQSVFDSEGRFAIEGLSAGSYLVRVYGAGHAPSDESTLTAPSTSARFVLSRGGRIEGTVVTAGGGPIENARVTLEGGSGDAASAVPITTTTVTDARGSYALEGIPPGAQSIFTAAGEHHARVISGLGVESGETLRVDVELTPTEPGESPRVELAGIGAVLSGEGDVMRVGRVIEGGGAAESGIAPGDAIVAVDGVPVTELGFTGAIQRLRGPEGTTVRITLRRADQTLQVTVPRRRIRA